MQKSSFTCLPGRMNEEVLLRDYQVQYVLIHVPERIYHVVIFCITQARGIKKSFHFVKIRLFGVGCSGGTKMEERDNFVLGVTKMAGLCPYVMKKG